VKCRKNRNSPVVLEGLPFIIPLGAFTVIAFSYGAFFPGVLLSFVTVLVIWFFRNPGRKVPQDAKAVISPADGKVISVENIAENDLLRGPLK